MIDGRISPSFRSQFDDHSQIDRLLACHSVDAQDPERGWAGPLHMGIPTISFAGLSGRVGDLLIAAAIVLARAARPGEPGWLAFEDTIPPEPARQPYDADQDDLDRAA